MPPDVDAPDPDSFSSISIVRVVSVGMDVTMNFLSVKSPDAKSEPVMDVKVSNNIISNLFMLCADENVSVTTLEPLVVRKAFDKDVVALIGCMS